MGVIKKNCIAVGALNENTHSELKVFSLVIMTGVIVIAGISMAVALGDDSGGCCASKANLELLLKIPACEYCSVYQMQSNFQDPDWGLRIPEH